MNTRRTHRSEESGHFPFEVFTRTMSLLHVSLFHGHGQAEIQRI
jgi:hypothetical protein